MYKMFLNDTDFVLRRTSVSGTLSFHVTSKIFRRGHCGSFPEIVDDDGTVSTSHYHIVTSKGPLYCMSSHHLCREGNVAIMEDSVDETYVRTIGLFYSIIDLVVYALLPPFAEM